MTERSAPVSPGSPEPPPWRHERKSVLRSFRYAWDGVLFVFVTQRHMRVHALIIGLVLFAAWGLGVTDEQLLLLVTAMALVLITEMVNTAVEMVVDLIVDSYNPQAKIIKDVAAGAVMVASVFAIAVGAVVFLQSPHLRQALASFPAPVQPSDTSLFGLLLIGALLLAISIGWLKWRMQRGTFLRGGAISGHTALGFMFATGIWVETRDYAVTALGLALAVLVSQSRLQARIHSLQEILLGAAAGIAAALLVFWPLGYVFR